MKKFNNNQKLELSDSATSADLQGETVILDIDAGTYYGLNEVGTVIWRLIESGEASTVDSLVQALLKEYDVDPHQCRKEVEQLLSDMYDNSLVCIDKNKY